MPTHASGMPRSTAKAVSTGEGCHPAGRREPRPVDSMLRFFALTVCATRSSSSTRRTPSAALPPRAKWSCSSAAIGVVGNRLTAGTAGKLGGITSEQTALACPTRRSSWALFPACSGIARQNRARLKRPKGLYFPVVSLERAKEFEPSTQTLARARPGQSVAPSHDP